MIALVKDALTGSLIAFGVLLLCFHVRAEVTSCQYFQAWCLQALQYATRRHHAKKERQGDVEEAMQIRRMVDEVRVQNFKMVIRWISGLMFFCVSYWIRSQEGDKYTGLLAWLLMIYAVILFSSYSHRQWTPARVTFVTTILHLMLLVRTCIIQEEGIWFLNSNIRVMMRLVMGLGDVDHRRTAVWNFLFAIVNITKHAQMSERVPVLQRPTSQILIIECTFCMLSWTASNMAQMWVSESVQLAFESSRSRMDKTMTDHLLSAFCDAQIKLRSDLQLLGPHDKIDQILMASSPAGIEPLQRTSFLDYLANADKARFKAFIEASSASSDQCQSSSSKNLYEGPKTLPSALHVHLRDFSGSYHPASIFHSAAMISSGEPHHLIGICVDISSEPTVYSAEHNGGSAEQHFHSKVPVSKKKSSLSSRSSSSSGRSKSSVRLIDMPHIKRLSVAFDPFDWSIQKISWHLPDVGHNVPTMHSCMVQPDSDEFRVWVQNQVSRLLFAQGSTSEQEGRSDLYGSLTLTLPRMSSSKQNSIFAKSAWLDLEDLDDVDDAEYDLISLQLEGLQEISGAGQVKVVMSTISE